MEKGVTLHDWEEVIRLAPKGECEIQGDGPTIIRGPIKNLSIDEDDNVIIELEWAAEMPKMGQPGFGAWRTSSQTTVGFPNLVVPYVLEATPEKGDRIRFGAACIMFLERKEGINTLNTSKVEGFQTPTPV